MEQVPAQMKAIVYEEKGKFPVLKTIDTPQPENGQVLVKIDSSPINPSDLLWLAGVYSSDKPFPNVPGFEGSGTVLKSGGGEIADSLVGKRVAVTNSDTQFGCYGQFAAINAKYVFEVEADVTLQQASCSYINPLTVIGMLEVTQAAKCPAVINTAAASALGRMFVRYFQKHGVKVINIIRRKEQAEILKKEGAEYILDQSDADFFPKLKALSEELKATILFDAIAGDITGTILREMPYGSKAYAYGALSGKDVGSVPIGDLIFKKKSVEGFWVTDWVQTRDILKQNVFAQELKGLITGDLKTDIIKEFALENFKEAVDFYSANMSAGKILIRPWL